MPGSNPSPNSGFTLIELVAAIVIVGTIAAVAVPVFRDLRYESRVAALTSIRAAIVTNYNLGRTACLARGPGPGSTVRIGGVDIEVYGENATVSGVDVPAGAPTIEGMYRLLGCGDPTGIADEFETTECKALPGYFVQFDRVTGWLYMYPGAQSSCQVSYFPFAGYDYRWPTPSAYDSWSGTDIAVEWNFSPSAAPSWSGC